MSASWGITHWTAEAIYQDATLSPAQKHVALALQHHADHATGECHPSIGRLAFMTSYDERTVQRVLAQLAQRGWQRAFRRSAQHRGNLTNRYRVRPVGPQRARPKGGVIEDHPLVIEDHQGGDRGSPKIHNRKEQQISAAPRPSRDLSSPPPPSAAPREPAAAVLKIVPTEVFDAAWRMFGGGDAPRALFRKLLRAFLVELGEGTRSADVCEFLRHQHKHRDLRGARVALAVVCDPEDFREWDRRRSSSSSSSSAPPPRPANQQSIPPPCPELPTPSRAAAAAAAAARAPAAVTARRRP